MSRAVSGSLHRPSKSMACSFNFEKSSKNLLLLRLYENCYYGCYC